MQRWQNISSTSTVISFINERWIKTKHENIFSRSYEEPKPIMFKHYILKGYVVEMGPVNGGLIELKIQIQEVASSSNKPRARRAVEGDLLSQKTL